MKRSWILGWFCVTVVTTQSIQCMGLPNVYFYKYEGDVQRPSFFAIEDCHQVELVRVNVKENVDAWMGPSGISLLVLDTTARQEPSGDFPPMYKGGLQLTNQILLKALLDKTPTRRDPALLERWLSQIHAPRPWTAGYLVATRPVAIAFKADARFSTGPSDETISELTFVTKRVFPVLVDTLQVAESDQTYRTITLKTPMSLQALLTGWNEAVRGGRGKADITAQGDARTGTLLNSVDPPTTRP